MGNSVNRDSLLSWILVTFGTVLSAVGYVIFILPLHLFEGGVTGLGIIAAKFLGKVFAEGKMLPITGTVSWALTILIFAVAVKILGRSFGAKSVYATTLLYFLMDGLLWFLQKNGYDAKIFELFSGDLLVAAIYGALSIGIGMAIVFNEGAATGGGDAFCQIIRKKFHIQIGKTMLVTDSIVLFIGFFTFDDPMAGFKTMMYSFIYIFICTQVLDTVLNGFKANQLVVINTGKPDELKEAILEYIPTGVTEYTAVGGFSHKERTILETVISKKRAPELKRIISDFDPDAFVIIQNTAQVYGPGFDELPKAPAKK
ncbi:MAG: YitT family protein [Candidatus Ozemobacteraceae bacterium]|jgi:uncharacterized membrane-anchored protein YitT (DUF2179 family)|nr:YitT family protein [Candidatus Riflebacteria bacterium]